MVPFLIGVVAVALAAWIVDRLTGRIVESRLRPRPADDFIVVAHRGASSHAPENTMAAFALAQQHGANGVECDVVFTADGVPVVAHHHDMSDRVAPEDRPAVIGKMTLEQVQRLDLGTWFDGRYAGERVPTLVQALEFFRGRFRRVYLHDKHDADLPAPDTGRLKIFARVIEESGLVDRIHVMVNSSDLSSWRAVSERVQLIQCRNGPDGRRRRIPLTVSFADGMRQLVVYASPRGLLQHGRILAKLKLENLGYLLGFWPSATIVRSYTERGAAFNVFTINDRLKTKLYMRAGFQAIGTNDPRMLAALVRELRGDAPDAPLDKHADA